MEVPYVIEPLAIETVDLKLSYALAAYVCPKLSILYVLCSCIVPLLPLFVFLEHYDWLLNNEASFVLSYRNFQLC